MHGTQRSFVSMATRNENVVMPRYLFLFDFLLDKLVPFFSTERGGNTGLDQSVEDASWRDMNAILPI